MTHANTAEDFWSHVDKSGGPDACWPWTRARTKRGYGVFRFQGRQWRANQLALVLTSGPLAPGHGALHTCDNPPCCNPSHLFSGTGTANSADMVAKGRAASGDRHASRIHGTGYLPRGDAHHSKRTPEVVARGERNGASVLTEDRVREVLRRRALGDSAYRIARDMGVTKGTIQFIVSGDTWKHVDRAPYSRPQPPASRDPAPLSVLIPAELEAMRAHLRDPEAGATDKPRAS